MRCEDAQILMMKRVDGVLGDGEEARLQGHVSGCDDCRGELGDFLEHKQVTDLIRERLQYDEALDHFWGGVHNRLEQRVGWSLVLIGVSICCGFGLVQLLMDPGVPAWLRIGTGAVGAGSLVLLASVVRWRLTTGGKDKYTEVIR